MQTLNSNSFHNEIFRKRCRYIIVFGLLLVAFAVITVLNINTGSVSLSVSEIADAIQELEKKFAGEGRVLIRPSGTEPLVRVMIEGKNQEEITEEAQKLADLITRVML